MTSSTENAGTAGLSSARFEMLPLRGAVERAEALPAGTTVTVTSSPRKGIDATLDLAGALAERGLHAVPHLSARLIRDTAHLRDVVDRVESLGSGEVFVVGGDSPGPDGQFPDALSLLRAMDDLGRLPARVGITGYPESHALIPDEATVTALAEKSRYAHYVVSQICYEPYTIAAWVKSLRSRGITLPVYVGVPGAVEFTKLLKISMKIGLGDSMRFLRKQRGVLPRLLTNYTADDIVEGLAPYYGDPEYDIAGWHLFTFNEVAQTLRWRDRMAEHQEEASA
jgi:methylenetetrahydrofolate reductase (NADPH)